MNAPALGSRVTVIQGGSTFIAEVTHHVGAGVFAWSVPHRGYSSTSLAADENIRWCRGWHAGDSAEVKAMKVARALGPDQAMDLHEASAAFISGKMSEEAWRRNLDLWDAEEHYR